MVARSAKGLSQLQEAKSHLISGIMDVPKLLWSL